MKTIKVLGAAIILSAASHASAFEFKDVGIGLGVPYGLLGANFDFNTTEKLDLTIGIGAGLDGLATNIGAKYYITKKTRVSVFYGDNGFLEIVDFSGAEIETYAFRGITAGLGWQFDNGWDFDIMLPITSKKDGQDLSDIADLLNADEQGSPVKISFGYSF